MQSVAILHNVPVSPSLTTSFIHMPGVGTTFSTAAQCSDHFALRDADPFLEVTAPCFLVGFGLLPRV